MNALNFHLDEDLIPLWQRALEMADGRITPDTVLLVQLLRRIENAQDGGQDEPGEEFGFDLVPVGRPVRPIDHQTGQLIDRLRQPNDQLAEELDQLSGQPLPGTQDEPAAPDLPPATRPQPTVAPQPRPTPTPRPARPASR